VPSAPTFGVKLGTNQRNAHVVRTPTALAGAVFDCARHCLDFDFVTRNPDYKHVVECIDTGSHDWLDFNLSDEAKYDLFRRGTEAAERFLRRFRWNRYKQLRSDLARAYHVDAHWNAQSVGS
jgi:NTE family protein